MSHDLLNGLQRITCDQLRELMPNRLPGIYALVDPLAPNIVRYVGSSTHIVKRLAAHATGYMPRNGDGPKRAWLAELKLAGRKPVAIVLEHVDAPTASAKMHAAERAWIERFRGEAQADLNATLLAGERKYLRAQIKKLEAENARLCGLLLQQQHEMQRCTNSCVAKSLKLQRNATGALEPVAVLQRIGGLTC
jgi:hypothetical protein